MKLLIKKLRSCAKVPSRATEGSAGLDLYAAIDEKIELGAGESAVIPTGIAISLPSNEYTALVFPRSGLSVKHGISMLNCVGVIDSDYRGEISVGLINQFKKSYAIEPGERIAQLIVMPVVLPEINVASELDETDRGTGGFGSTGR